MTADDPTKPLDPKDKPPRDTRENPAKNPNERPDTKSSEEFEAIRPHRRP
jgi:hypothetical protein